MHQQQFCSGARRLCSLFWPGAANMHGNVADYRIRHQTRQDSIKLHSMDEEDATKWWTGLVWLLKCTRIWIILASIPVPSWSTVYLIIYLTCRRIVVPELRIRRHCHSLVESFFSTHNNNNSAPWRERFQTLFRISLHSRRALLGHARQTSADNILSLKLFCRP